MSNPQTKAQSCPHCGQMEQPPGWGNDGVTDFFDKARQSAYATFYNLPDEYSKLSSIDKAYRTSIDSLYKSKEVFAGLFLLQTHASFLASVSLSMSVQLSEAYACLRLTLENALYGFYLCNNPESRKTWLDRDDEEEAKKKVRKEFTIRNLLNDLNASNTAKGSAFENLYDYTIKYGAHPNPGALLQRLDAEKNSSEVQLKLNYLSGNTEDFHRLLKTTSQVGVCSLGIFELVYPERFALVGLTDTLNKLR